MPQVILGGTTVQLLEFEDAVRIIGERATGSDARPLGVVSANLDHLHHFGKGERWAGALDSGSAVEWLSLMDGAPLVAQAQRLTGQQWPRLAGSDLIGPLLDVAAANGARIGFLGGTPETQELLKKRLRRQRPELVVAGCWTPERSALSDPLAASALATEVAAAEVDMLVVGLGKPRQELWIAEYGPRTGAKVLLAFGAVVDFLAGRVRRSPEWVSSHSLEWAWRLALEPKRLARRYLVEGPRAYLSLRRGSTRTQESAGDSEAPTPLPTVHPTTRATFTGPDEHADVCVLSVTYNSAEFIEPFLESLRAETKSLSLRVVIADNGSVDGTLEILERHRDVVVVRTGGNLGYAGGINVAQRHSARASALLILNPDLRVTPGSVAAMYASMDRPRVAAVVPVLLDFDGTVHHSLRREPALGGIYGDALFGSRYSSRPVWLSETDFDEEAYSHSHFVDWATGAAIMIRSETATAVGPWDEAYFLYSEEVDYCRRIRESGGKIWFESSARVWHRLGGSGSSPALTALMAVNRIKYAHHYHSRSYAALFRAGVVLGELLRSYQPDHRPALSATLNKKRWARLPGPSVDQPTCAGAHVPAGSIIIPAHNEEKVIDRCLTALDPMAAGGTVEIYVVCNGCADGTADIARLHPGVNVIEVPQASKIAALNAGDAAASRWPRIYLDADIEIPEQSVQAILETLSSGTALAGRPDFHYDASGASVLVRSYYRARSRIPSLGTTLWGACVFAMTESGRGRFTDWPDVTADDLFAHRLFSPEEWIVVDGAAVQPRTPRTSMALLKILRRHHRGSAALEPGTSTTRETFAGLIQSVHGPGSAVDAAVYTAFAAFSRIRPKRNEGLADIWERDETSRIQEPSR